MRERLGQIGITGLYLWLLARVVHNWQTTGRVTGAIAVLGFSLAVYFTVARRGALRVDGTWTARLATSVATVGPLLMRPSGESPIPDHWTGLLALVGGLIVWTGLLSLGRSFALLPAHRGKIARRGLYRIVRHPLYAGYLLVHLSWVLAYPGWWNFTLWLLIETSQIVRLVHEERLLAIDPAYRAYQSAVRWRLLPGVY